MTDSTDNALGPFRFDRYINGKLMAEGVKIIRERNLEDAMVSAARIASRGRNGEVPVLIYRADLAPDPLADERVKALVGAAQDVKDFRYDPSIGIKLNILESALAAFDKGGKDAD